ncbi:MAG: hypothetical protein H6623_01685 [Bdellovibrionaceae bacterium]|nr:hypothetical protein [Pseudobdellovibrionaceae bacterium]
MKKLFMKIVAFFQKESGGKTVVDKRKLGFFLVIILILTTVSWFAWTFFTNDTSVLMKTTASAKEQAKVDEERSAPTNDDGSTGTVGNSQVLGNVPKSTKPSRKTVKPFIKYKASQIIDLSSDESSSEKQNARGTVVRVRLLTSVDTREPSQICKAMVLDRSMLGLPAKSLLFGSVTMGASRRAIINFDHALLPTGEELSIKAQAIDSKTNLIGIIGDYHGKLGSRAIGTMALNMASGMSEVLAQKESLGGIQGQVAVKSSLKNAFYNGIAKTAESEAGRQAEQLNQEPEYVLLKNGTEFSIQLLEKVEEKI